MLVLKTGFDVSKHEKFKYKYENVSREGSCPHTGNGNIIRVLPVCGWECEGHLTLLAEYSQMFNEIINTIDKCKMCKVYINLPDHNVKSILKLVELLSNGETNILVSVKYHSC